MLVKVICFLIVQTFASGQLIVGGSFGWGSTEKLSSVEIFPPPNDTCSVPSLPGPRSHHSLSLLSGGRLAVCGGEPASEEKSCIVWMRGSTSWTHLHTTRSSYHIFTLIKISHQQCGADCPCGLVPAIPSRLYRAAGRQWCCRDHCRDCARF